MYTNLIVKKVQQQLSQKLASRSPKPLSDKELVGFKEAQELAFAAAEYTAKLIQPGWSESQTAQVLNTYLRDMGVKHFFHYAYVWFGERTKFSGFNRKNYKAFMPTSRVLRENEAYILDVAPIVNGYICDIGYSKFFGESADYIQAKNFLDELYLSIPKLFVDQNDGSQIWQKIDDKIKEKGYENIHKLYPFSVLGHRVYNTSHSDYLIEPSLLNFGWQSYWQLFKRGLMGELLGPNFLGSLDGLWAIEPHIATANFGLKFEELLLIENHQAIWLKDWDKEHGSKS